MVKWCGLFLKFLEGKHAGRSTWIQLVCDLFACKPSTLGRRIIHWYTPDMVEEDQMDAESRKQLAEGEKVMSTLTVLRQDIQTGQRDIWDIAGLILQKPKSDAMATLVGFGPEDVSVVQDLWPEFLAYLRCAASHPLLAYLRCAASHPRPHCVCLHLAATPFEPS